MAIATLHSTHQTGTHHDLSSLRRAARQQRRFSRLRHLIPERVWRRGWRRRIYTCTDRLVASFQLFFACKFFRCEFFACKFVHGVEQRIIRIAV